MTVFWRRLGFGGLSLLLALAMLLQCLPQVLATDLWDAPWDNEKAESQEFALARDMGRTVDRPQETSFARPSAFLQPRAHDPSPFNDRKYRLHVHAYRSLRLPSPCDSFQPLIC